MSHDKATLEHLRIDRAGKQPAQAPRVILVIVSVLLLAGGVAWWMTRPKAARVKTVTVHESTAGGRQTLLNASGYVTAHRQATVSSKITGKVVELLVEEGMKVKEGQVLARLDSSNVEKSLRLAEAQLESAQKSLNEMKASLEQAERELRRVSELATNKIANQSDLDKAEADAKTWRARFERQIADIAVADRQVDAWRQQMDDTIIRAPFAGIVTSKNAQPGEMISPMSVGGFTRTGICTLVDMTSLEIEVDVNESYINRVEAGQEVQSTLDSYPDWQIPSKVIAIIPTADRQKATVKVRVGFEKLDPRILPDMGVKVAFQSSSGPTVAARTISIPKTAVFQKDGRDYVWLLQADRLQRRALTIGGTRNDEVTVAAGLTSGERIVISPSENLADGMRVTEEKP
jgi:HlyD family secretion protein